MKRPSEYLQSLGQRIEEWEYQFDRFQHHVADLGDKARVRADQQVAELRALRGELKEKLQHLEDQGEHALEDIRDGLELAWDGLHLGLLTARAEFEAPGDD